MDIRTENVILVETDPLAFVIIDFGRAEPRWMDGIDYRDKIVSR